MLSYRHGFHAGNRADVFKHSVLVAFLKLYTKKQKPFAAFDIHAGGGVYQLTSEHALQTGEAAEGIIPLVSAFEKKLLPQPIPESLEAYLNLNLRYYRKDCSYAGSPEIIKNFLRQDDELILCDLHPAEGAALRALYKNEKRIHVHIRNGYEAVCALTPPKSGRGFVLIDPSYEVDSDYENVITTVQKLHKRWRAASFIIWYPILKRREYETAELKKALSALKGSESFYVENPVRPDFLRPVTPPPAPPAGEYGLQGSGMFVINPPWGMQEAATTIAEWLRKV
ncbi:23S rRNA (adenine(2030)-N(6))-methyltransferase RlmJ [Treponema phagedenis]|uniref:23S rRNA (adenine(2030)-N(6))-methyltransferase RlmJ n=1 Tax=Treponema phagedenis TaxID=162 RepID=UPI00197E0D95|nr:23S rRNA (adenine(2030)-N(6))-methyltransferase RlmJ [Treponema phagedenis]QSH95602.1 23S rRNA (adenine(2030)-N(6))-methyltransferase RlmJ [Treponema phagedenis]